MDRCYKECPNRAVGCHSTCPIYIQQRSERDEINRKRHKINQQTYGFGKRSLAVKKNIPKKWSNI